MLGEGAFRGQTVVDEHALPELREFVRSYTDGESIFVSQLPDSWLLASVVIQASLLAAGSLEPGVMARLTGRRQLRLRYLTLAAVSATPLLRTGVPARVV